jgi:cytoskeletal protein CcmA (bactofilin family)
VSGPVTARKKLVVAKSGSLTGDVRVARLVIQDGATFSGKVSMGPQPEAPVEPAAPEAAPEVETAPVPEAAPAGKNKAPASKGKPKR